MRLFISLSGGLCCLISSISVIFLMAGLFSLITVEKIMLEICIITYRFHLQKYPIHTLINVLHKILPSKLTTEIYNTLINKNKTINLDDTIRHSNTLNYGLVPCAPHRQPNPAQSATIYTNMTFVPHFSNKILKIWKTCTAKIGFNIINSWTPIPPSIHSNLSLSNTNNPNRPCIYATWCMDCPNPHLAYIGETGR